jgi:hypothetical protein
MVNVRLRHLEIQLVDSRVTAEDYGLLVKVLSHP